MQIRHSTEVARPIETGKKPARWPWVLGGIGVAIVLVLGAGIGWLLWSQSGQTETVSQQEEVQESEGGTEIASQPLDSELQTIVYGLYEDPQSSSELAQYSGPLTIYSAAQDEDGSVASSILATYEREDAQFSVNGTVSPNGQFMAFVDPRPIEGAPGSADLEIVDITTGEITNIEKLDTSTAFGPVWSEDSSQFYVVANTYAEPTAPASSLSGFEACAIMMVDAATNQAQTYDRSEAESDNCFVPLAVRDDVLFVMQTKADSSGAELGTITLGSAGEADNDFESLLELDRFQAAQYIDVSEDGQQVVIARSASGADNERVENQSYIDLLDVDSGEVTTLRESETEGYVFPRFAGDAIVYGAASGIWYYDLKTDERDQLFDESLLSEISASSVHPQSVRPDGEVVAIFVSGGVAGGDNQILLMPISGVTDLDDIASIGEPPLAERCIFGWTE